MNETPDEIVRALRVCNRAKGHRCSECPIFSRYEYGVCKRTVDLAAADLIEQLNDFEHSQCAKLLARIAELETQLGESQRREKAAVEDINSMLDNVDSVICCHYCAKSDHGEYCGFDSEGENGELVHCPGEWRGPQEAGKVETDGFGT